MGGFVKGDVVVAPFPFSDLSSSKRRPSLVVAQLEGDDLVLSQITGKKRSDRYAISLDPKDFSSGKLRVPSLIRPNRLFTADARVVLYKAGSVTAEKMQEVTAGVIEILEA